MINNVYEVLSMPEVFHYIDDEGNEKVFLPMGQGPATLLTEQEALELARDRIGFTHPNLHRRIDNSIKYVAGGQEYDAKYSLNVGGVNSYRTTQFDVHEEYPPETEIDYDPSINESEIP